MQGKEKTCEISKKEKERIHRLFCSDYTHTHIQIKTSYHLVKIFVFVSILIYTREDTHTRRQTYIKICSVSLTITKIRIGLI